MKNQLNGVLMGFMLMISSALVFYSCDDSRGECRDKVSQTGDDDSHKNGENCMNCHVSGGKGEGCFNVAGSVYDNLQAQPVNSGTIKLFTGPNGTGTEAASIQVDSKGNFYTTNSVNFSGGLYPVYTNSNGQSKYMGVSIGTGSCNSCHNVSTSKIFAP